MAPADLGTGAVGREGFRLVVVTIEEGDDLR